MAASTRTEVAQLKRKRKVPMDELEKFVAESRSQWRDWLEQHHSVSPGVWLVTYKKGSERPVLDYDAIIEEALAFGWIDSVARKVDEQRTSRLMTPRKPTSSWSALNKARVERLMAAGLMAPAGLAAVELAKRNGGWIRLDAVEALTVPDDLARAFAAHRGSREEWEAFPRTAKRGILEWIGAAKRQETRAARVEETAALAAKGQRANQYVRKEAKKAKH